MKTYRISTVMHPNTSDSYQGLVWAEAYYCEGNRFPWLLLTPTQLVLLARAGRITLLALMESSADEISAITGCAPETAADLVTRIADDAAYWTSQTFVEECRAIRPDWPTPAPTDFDALRQARPEYRTPSTVELVPTPRVPSYPWPRGEGWNAQISHLLVGQFEGTGSELRHLLSKQAAALPGLERYLKDSYVIAKSEARRGELKGDLDLLAEDAKTYDLAQWLVGELRRELRSIEDYLDRWLATHP